MKRPDLLLVNPANRISQFGGISEYATVAPPLGIAMVAAFARREGYSVDILDAEAEEWSVEKTVEEICRRGPMLVGLTAFTTKMTAAGDILKALKREAPYMKTMIGGHHPSALPERTLREEGADFVIEGEGYRPVTGLLRAMKDGKRAFPINGVWTRDGGRIVSRPAAPLADIDELPLPAWDLLPMGKYRAHHWQCWGMGRQSSFALVFTSLGCPFQCSFCSVNVVYGRRRVRYKTVSRVMEDFEVLADKFRIKHIEIIDDTFTLDRDRVIAICDSLIERRYDLNMWCFARTDTVDPGMLERMKRAGINWVFLGIEAGNEKILNGVFKKQNLAQIKDAVDAIHGAGISIGGNYVFGLPDDDHDTMKETLDLAQELNLEWANFFISMAYPGTAIYEDAVRNSCVPERWEQYGFFAPNARPTPTKHLSGEEILRFRDEAFEKYFSNARYLDMIRGKFGPETADYVTDMLKRKIKRDYKKSDLPVCRR
ncbi:MAG: radical SAM protein [Candidatus Omnitrophota bacterium]